MPAKKKSPEEKRNKNALHVPLNALERAELDRRRGMVPAAIYARGMILGGGLLSPQAPQDAPRAQVSSAPAPQAPPAICGPQAAPKEEIRVPPPGQADPHGWHMRYLPESASRGTLLMAQPGEDWKSVDLIGTEVTHQPDGSTLVRFTDRSLVRASAEED